MQVDIKTLLNFEPSILPQSTTAATTGSAVDTQGYNSAVAFGFVDALSTGTFKVTNCATATGSYTDVADANVITSDGINGTAAVASDIVTIGVIDTLRYLKVVFTPTTTAAASFAAGIALGNAQVSPTGTNS